MEIENLLQLDGNVSVNISNLSHPDKTHSNNVKVDKISAALHLPTLATYNLRSLIPKINSLRSDIIERKVDVAFLQEIWEKEGDKTHEFELEKLLELHGLEYYSKPRPVNNRGNSYGGAAVIINKEKFFGKKIDVAVPKNMEVVWVLVKPKYNAAKFKKFIACSFYSPPNNRKNSQLADYIVKTLHMLACSGLILGADRNRMDILPILDCGLKLRQIVDKNTHGRKILDIIITNLYSYYNMPIICPPIGPDNPKTAEASDHFVPVCFPHTNRFKPPQRNYRIIKYRPLPQSGVNKFGEWITAESWQSVNDESSPTEQVSQLHKMLSQKLETFCPEKSLKISQFDKPFITAELKRLHRQREYWKHRKSLKYNFLVKSFKAL